MIVKPIGIIHYLITLTLMEKMHYNQTTYNNKFLNSLSAAAAVWVSAPAIYFFQNHFRCRFGQKVWVQFPPGLHIHTYLAALWRRRSWLGVVHLQLMEKFASLPFEKHGDYFFGCFFTSRSKASDCKVRTWISFLPFLLAKIKVVCT